MTAPFLQRITNNKNWNDLNVGSDTLSALNAMAAQVQSAKVGVALFTAPPGTGKTMAASLLGKLAGREVFRVDLSMVVSKYIGETEKNIASLFDDSQKLPPVLLFDEADALFGKRTTVRDAHDRYANLDASDLLQKMEDYQGLVILVANSRTTFDAALIRRIRWVIEFTEQKPHLSWWEILLKWVRLKF